MRLQIENKTDRDVEPYVRLAAQVVNVSRKVYARIYYVRRGSWQWYTGLGGGNRISVGMPRDGEGKFPFEKTKLNYFRSHNIPLKKPYRVDNWHELLVSIAAHEFAHCTPNGIKWRKSVIEVNCEAKAAEALELFRSPEGQAFIQKYQRRVQDRARIAGERRAYQGSTEAKLARLRAREKAWTTRLKRGVTAMKKIKRAIKRLEKLQAGQPGRVAPSSIEPQSDTMTTASGINQ